MVCSDSVFLNLLQLNKSKCISSYTVTRSVVPAQHVAGAAQHVTANAAALKYGWPTATAHQAKMELLSLPKTKMQPASADMIPGSSSFC
jgi:hypothetical protein